MASTIILITGANSGVGLASSKVIASASKSYHVIVASRTLEKATAAVSEIEAAGVKGSLSAVQLDVTDEDSIKAAAESVERQFGRLDVLVNNAAVGGLDLDFKTSYQICLETNVLGPALVSETFRPLLLKSDNAYSVYVGSGERTLTRNAMQKPPSHPVTFGAYQVSKAALNMVAILDARDHGPEGLKVFVLSPGFVRSNLRGKSEERQTGWGMAGDPEVSGQILLSIIQGKRDADVGLLVYKDGIHPW